MVGLPYGPRKDLGKAPGKGVRISGLEIWHKAAGLLLHLTLIDAERAESKTRLAGEPSHKIKGASRPEWTVAGDMEGKTLPSHKVAHWLVSDFITIPLT